MVKGRTKRSLEELLNASRTAIENDERQSEEYEENEDEIEKKRSKLMSNLILINEIDHNHDKVRTLYIDPDANYVPISFDEFCETTYESSCYGCEHMSTDSLTDNETFLYMMKLYYRNSYVHFHIYYLLNTIILSIIIISFVNSSNCFTILLIYVY